ncbi:MULTISPECIES: thioredoxin domain-containing protein [Exiguobacterium]|uniref:Thioredoxin domain-containing protein n=1 Tax=Exiguobacterium mexicanum TaxID=340146 RepID=A0ABT7MM49_9BACL|nr:MULTISPECIES: thioredoxin domain-containing protein [Exiguobacterium]KGI83888.1 dihydroneopterin aldolase [Exiguobacterium mexicanum]MDL5376255.1 thioredoxin domain-containing protein [Exiguobacterium mexicanum]RHB45813.1 DsbA family protein [Exiguobacterium sp. AM39-5BH]TCI66640.1 DsbA family protein [Exiguobacterium sp. IPCI3]TCI75963.1 DsbA family protein [Exiguobacterium sp. IPCH1]
MKTNQLLTIFTSVLVIAVLAFLFLNDQSSEKSKTKIVQDEKISVNNQPTIGKKEAPISIVEFGDYKCPSCKEWGETIYPQLVKDYIESGKASFSYINVLFHGDESTLAALASESVYKNHPESFWQFHKAIYEAQPDVQIHDNPWVTVEKMEEIATKTVPSLDLNKFREDLSSRSSRLESVKMDAALVEKYNVTLTPTIAVNGVILENPFDYTSIKKQIEKELTQ